MSHTRHIWYIILSDDSVAEAGSIMSLAPSGARGKYLALWIVARNVSHLLPFRKLVLITQLGQLVGGAIK